MIKLLPFKYKILGIIIVLIATVLTFLYFILDLRVELPVLAVVSSYIDTRFFTFFTTNVIEEVVLLLFLSGFSLLVFTKEKNEKYWVQNIRIKAWGNTIVIYVIWLTITTILIFGSAYVSVLIINIVLPFIIYIIVFYSIYLKTIKRRRFRILQQKLFRKSG